MRLGSLAQAIANVQAAPSSQAINSALQIYNTNATQAQAQAQLALQAALQQAQMDIAYQKLPGELAYTDAQTAYQNYLAQGGQSGLGGTGLTTETVLGQLANPSSMTSNATTFNDWSTHGLDVGDDVGGYQDISNYNGLDNFSVNYDSYGNPIR